MAGGTRSHRMTLCLADPMRARKAKQPKSTTFPGFKEARKCERNLTLPAISLSQAIVK